MQPSFLLRQPILALLRFCAMTFFGIRLSFSYMPNNRGAPRISWVTSFLTAPPFDHKTHQNH